MHIPWRPASTALIAAVIAVTAVLTDQPRTGQVANAAGDRSRPTSSPSQLSEGPASTLSYWTPGRMSSATPMESDRDRRPRSTDSSVVRRQPHTIAGVDVPDDSDGRIVKAAQNQPAAAYPFPFGRRRVEDPLRNVGPYRAVGRIFFRQGDVNYSCSGASVVSGPRQVVFTAGHCLNDGLGSGPVHWSKDVIFVPARKTGKQKNPYGVFPAKELWAPEGWTLEGLDAFDMGAFSVGRNASGRNLQKSVGALGFAFNQGRVQHWDIFGYPAVGAFKGNRLITCASSFGVEDIMIEGPNTTGVGCDMTGGSSGGPWIIRLRRGNLLNGITTYGYQAQPAAVYGPFFDGTANNVRCAAATGNQNATSC